MKNRNKLEELRTRKELVNYFRQLGKNINEEEINALKQSYQQTEENNGKLTLQQLDDVAGGVEFYMIFGEVLSGKPELKDKLLAALSLRSSIEGVRIRDLKSNGLIFTLTDGDKPGIRMCSARSINKINGCFEATFHCSDVELTVIRGENGQVYPNFEEISHNFNICFTNADELKRGVIEYFFQPLCKKKRK